MKPANDPRSMESSGSRQISTARPSILAVPFERASTQAALQVLDARAQDDLASISVLVTLPPHATLYKQGEEAGAVFNIVSGAVETYETYEDGRRRITAFLFPKDLVGLSENGRYVAGAETLNEVCAYKIPMQGLREILNREPRLSVGLLLKLCHDLRDAQHHALTISGHSAHGRVATFLLWLHEALNMRSAMEELSLPMTRQDIADYLGLSVESISRALHVLETEGAIRRKGTRIINLVDHARLVTISGER